MKENAKVTKATNKHKNNMQIKNQNCNAIKNAYKNKLKLNTNKK